MKLKVNLEFIKLCRKFKTILCILNSTIASICDGQKTQNGPICSQRTRKDLAFVVVNLKIDLTLEAIGVLLL